MKGVASTASTRDRGTWREGKPAPGYETLHPSVSVIEKGAERSRRRVRQASRPHRHDSSRPLFWAPSHGPCCCVGLTPKGQRFPSAQTDAPAKAAGIVFTRPAPGSSLQTGPATVPTPGWHKLIATQVLRAVPGTRCYVC